MRDATQRGRSIAKSDCLDRKQWPLDGVEARLEPEILVDPGEGDLVLVAGAVVLDLDGLALERSGDRLRRVITGLDANVVVDAVSLGLAEADHPQLLAALIAISTGVEDMEALGVPADVGRKLLGCYDGLAEE